MNNSTIEDGTSKTMDDKSESYEITHNYKNNSKTDNFQFILALVIVVPFVTYIGIFYATNMTQQAKDILTMMGAFVGTIVGFYFGQRPVQNLTKQVQQESAAKTKFKTDAGESVTEALSKAEEVRKAKQEAIEKAEELRKTRDEVLKLSQKLMDMHQKYELIIRSVVEKQVKRDNLRGRR